MPFVVSWMDLEDTLSEIRQSQGDEYCMIQLIWGIWNKLLDAENIMVVVRGMEEVGKEIGSF